METKIEVGNNLTEIFLRQLEFIERFNDEEVKKDLLKLHMELMKFIFELIHKEEIKNSG